MAAAVISLLREGRSADAFDAARQLAADHPHDPVSLHLLGVLYSARQEWNEASSLLQRAVDLEPEQATWWRDLGVVLICEDRARDAVRALERSLVLAPEAGSLAYYAEALAATGAETESLKAIRQAREFSPPSATTEFAIGRALELLQRWKEAAQAYEKCLALEPASPGCCERLAGVYIRLNFPERSYQIARRAAKLTRYQPASLHRIAIAQFELGRLRSAIRTLRRALAREPDANIHSELLVCLLHDPAQSATALRKEHESWFCSRASARRPATGFPNTREPGRRLRIGYPSRDFRLSPSQHFLLPFFQNHDRTHFEVYCYQVEGTEDSATQDFRRAADQWRDLCGRPAQEIRSQILRDNIDILIHASGLLDPQALAVFSPRAAPVQAAFPLYPSTTGCRDIDWLLTDSCVAPDVRAAGHYSERQLYRVPSGYFAFRPPADCPAVAPLPALANGFVTFGVFQRRAKLHPEFWDAAAAILRRCPRSKLSMQFASREVGDSESLLRKNVLLELGRRGIAAERIQILAGTGFYEHLNTLSRADIALDSWPYNGQTTTCFCLWMGVPVVSLAGETHASRIGRTILQRAGLPDWAATSLEGYIETAVRHAQDINMLASLRSSLREHVGQSPTFRPEIVTREIETAYRFMWREWCGKARAAAVALS